MELTLSVLGPNSKPISRLPYNAGVQADDLMLIARDVCERGCEPVPDEQTLGRILLEEYGVGPDDPVFLEARTALKYLYDEGWKLRYADLSSRLLSDISARFGFRNMAYREEWQYDLKNHAHPYNTIAAFPTLTYAQVSAMYTDKSQCVGPHEISEYLGTVETYRQNPDDTYTPVSVDLYMPHVEFPPYPDPDIGEVRFLARNPATTSTQNPRLTTVYSDNDMLYDEENGGYWVYPRGQTVNCPAGEFQSACLVYGATRHAADTSFSVPLIRDFIKPSPVADSSLALKHVGWQNGLIPHSDHEIDNSTLQRSENRLIVDTTMKIQTKGGSEYAHSGTGNVILGKINMISVDVPLQDIKNQPTQTDYSEDSLNRETYPKHQNPVCIVYIGRK